MFDFCKKYYILFLVFFISLFLNFYHIKWNEIPFYTGDSSLYIGTAQSILNLKFPNLSVRSPVYPLLLTIPCFFNQISLIVPIQTIISSFSFIFLYLIFYKTTKSKLFSFFSIVFINLDYNVIQFQSLVLTESLSISVFIILSYLHLVQINHNNSKKYLGFLLFIDFIAILLRPSLIPIPLFYCVAAIFLIKIKYVPSHHPQKAIKFLAFTLFFNFFIIFTQCTINLVQHNMFTISDVGQINVLGKSIVYGYLDKEYQNAPTLLTPTQNIYKQIEIPEYQSKKEDAPNVKIWPLLGKMEDKGLIKESYTPYLKEINNFLINQNKSDYYFRNIILIKDNFTSYRNYYSWYQLGSPASHFFYKKEFLFIFINQFKLISFINCFFILIYQILKKKKEIVLSLGLILSSIFITIVTVSWFSFDEYSRLRINVEPFMDFTIIYPIYFIISKIKELLIKKN